MIKQFKYWIVLIAIAASFSLQGQSLPKTFLWQVSGNGLEKPSYLFGTIHIIYKDYFKLEDTLIACFKQSDRLVLELDLYNDTTMFAALGRMFLPPGQTIKDWLSDEDYQLFEAYYKDSLGTNETQFNTSTVRMKPLLLMSGGGDLSAGKKKELAFYDIELAQMARTDDKPIQGLETALFQAKCFDSIPLQEQVALLKEHLHNPDTSDQLGKLMQLYRDKEVDSLLIYAQQTSPELMKYENILLKHRNANWVKRMHETILPSGTSFIAVGAAHLSGEHGLIALLRKQGYQVEPIMNP